MSEWTLFELAGLGFCIVWCVFIGVIYYRSDKYGA